MSLSRPLGDKQDATSDQSSSRLVDAAEILRAIQTSQAAAIEAASATAARMVEDKLESFKRELTEEAATKAVKKARADKQPTFKRKGNEHQFVHNAAVLDKVDEAIEALERSDIERTKESLQQGKALLLKRQKLIKLADREECGWDVVQEYLSDELASDSDDEKHIARSRKAAATKRKKTNSANSGRQFKNYRRARTPYSQTIYQRGLPQSSASSAHSTGPINSAQHFTGQSDGRWSHTMTSRQNAICFTCGLKGQYLDYLDKFGKVTANVKLVKPTN